MSNLVKVTRKFQVTIPEEVRKKARIEIGEKLLVRYDDGRIVMHKTPDIEKLAGAWQHIEDTEDFMTDTRRLWKTWALKQC
ncbi:MAG: AbrB/MazE/SpoVT family DNA-binding domain-containing protein [Thaumarchaeota archaeon]|nr:AbrB/MazE/SpoVT family DNA-binding domain-containing protein [Nitrososphaerota archaeon]